MTKMIVSIVVILVMATAVLSARDVVGHISTDDVVVEYGMMSRPIMSSTMPKINAPSVLIKYPAEVMSFLEREGIAVDEMNGNFVTDELAKKICDICEGQESEFCSIMRGIVAQFSNPQYEVYIVKVGSLYWTVYA